MENDELKNQENEIEPVQELSEESPVEVDPYQNGASQLESEQIQSEDSATDDEKLLETSLDEPSEPISPPEEKEVKKMPGWLSKSLIYGGVGILLLLAGFLIAFFTTTVPAQNSFQTIQQELKNKDNELNDLQTKFDQIDSVLTETKSDVALLNKDYQSLELQHNQLLANSEFNQNLIDFKYEISRAKFALLNDDFLSTNLAISLAKDKFEKIQILLDSDISTGMSDQLQEIQKLVSTDPDKALDELRTLNENLERIQLK